MAGVVEEPLGHRVLQRAHVLAPQPVVRHPFLVVVVFGPGDGAQVGLRWIKSPVG